jgi:DNA polymerase-3 subunit delta'
MAKTEEQSERAPAKERLPDVGLLEIVGQDSAVARLEEGLGGARRPHAYIFAGPQGVGRRTTAIAMAKTLLCERPKIVANKNAGNAAAPNSLGFASDAAMPPRFADLPPEFEVRQACGVCSDCKVFAGGSHPDFHLIYKELAAYHEDSAVRDRVMQELGIPVIRSFLIEAAARRAARGRGKVFVVLEAELMSAAAQNALLKTLEEPPPGVTIILVAEQPEQLLPTTLSRCRMVRFGLLPRDFVVRKLVEQGTPPPEAAFWSAFTDGSVGRAARLRARGMYEVKTGMIDRLAAMNRAGDADLGEDLHKQTESLAESVIKSTRTGQTEMSKSLAVRQTTGMMLELIAAAYRDAITLASRAPREIVYADQRPAVAAIAAKFDLMQLASIIEQLSEFERLLWRNVNAKNIWYNVVITCASAAPLSVGE